MTEPRPGAGEIRREAVYSVREFCRRTGISRDTVRRYIKPRHIAGKAYVLGEEFVELVKSQPTTLPHEGDLAAQGS